MNELVYIAICHTNFAEVAKNISIKDVTKRSKSMKQNIFIPETVTKNIKRTAVRITVPCCNNIAIILLRKYKVLYC